MTVTYTYPSNARYAALVDEARTALLVEIQRVFGEEEWPVVDAAFQSLEEETDYFEAPASSRHHLCVPHGLFMHSWGVYRLGNALRQTFPSAFYGVTNEEWFITALFHDLCKVNFYAKAPSWRKDENGRWQQYYRFEVKDTFPMGHGEKSIFMLTRYLRSISKPVALAIRWHMGNFDPAASSSPYSSKALDQARKEHPLVSLIQLADYSTVLHEKETAIRPDVNGAWVDIALTSDLQL